MKTNTNTPTLPLTVKSNQYSYPCKTYYYIVDASGLIYHYSDGKWRAKSLMELWTHAYSTEFAAIYALSVLTTSLRPVATLGRPPIPEDTRKATYRVGLTKQRYDALTTAYGSLANAVASIKIPTAKVLVILALACASLTSCSDYLCPAYSSIPKHSNHRR